MSRDLCLPAHRCALLLALGAVAIPVQAGRPLATDDAAVLDAGACQLESWTEHARGSRGAWLNAGCNPFGRTELSLGAARVRATGSPASTIHPWQIKHLLRAHDDARYGLAVALGGQRMGRGAAHESFLNGIATLPLAGQARLLHLNLGVLRTRDEDRGRTRATWGIAYDAQVAGATWAAIETFGRSGERANWQVGLRHELVPGRVQIDGSIGSAIGRWSATRVFTVGLVFVSPGLLR